MFKHLLLLICLVAASCAPGESAIYDVELNFKVVGNDQLVDINTPSNHTNGQNQTYTVSKFEMLISDIFLTSNANTLQAKHVEEEISPDDKRIAEYHIVDIENASTLSISKAGLVESDGYFSYLTFRFGLNSEDNQTNALPNETNFNNFAWPIGMGGGYHYMKFEGNEDVNSQSFEMHAGPTSGNDYSFVVTLPIRKSIENGKLVLNVMIDINKFFSNNFEFSRPIKMIMGSTEAQEFIKTNGVNAFTLE